MKIIINHLTDTNSFVFYSNNFTLWQNSIFKLSKMYCIEIVTFWKFVLQKWYRQILWLNFHDWIMFNCKLYWFTCKMYGSNGNNAKQTNQKHKLDTNIVSLIKHNWIKYLIPQIVQIIFINLKLHSLMVWMH